MDISTNKTIGEILSEALAETGHSKAWLGRTTGLNKNTIGCILNDKTAENSSHIHTIAKVLDLPLSVVYQEDLRKMLIMQTEHSLLDAPECIKPYVLILENKLDFLPRNTSVIIAPLTESARNTAIFWLYRARGHKRAMILRSILKGDSIVLVDAQVSPSSRQNIQEYIPCEGGVVLGVLQDVASCALEFHRQ